MPLRFDGGGGSPTARSTRCDPPSGLRKLDDERRAGAELGVELQAASHALGELASDVEPEARAARRTCELRIGAIELLEDLRLVGEGDPRPRIDDADPDHTVRAVGLDLERAGAVLDGVVEQ